MFRMLNKWSRLFENESGTNILQCRIRGRREVVERAIDEVVTPKGANYEYTKANIYDDVFEKGVSEANIYASYARNIVKKFPELKVAMWAIANMYEAYLLYSPAGINTVTKGNLIKEMIDTSDCVWSEESQHLVTETFTEIEGEDRQEIYCDFVFYDDWKKSIS